jgi:hypothetical protein
MNTTEETQTLTEEQKLIEYKLYKQRYNKQRYLQKKEEIKENQKLYYINRVTTDPTFRNTLAERTKNRYYKNKEQPKLSTEQTKDQPEQPIKKIGRPRKY